VHAALAREGADGGAGAGLGAIVPSARRLREITGLANQVRFEPFGVGAIFLGGGRDYGVAVETCQGANGSKGCAARGGVGGRGRRGGLVEATLG